MVTRDPVLMEKDDKSDWYRAYWRFIVAYLDDKYGDAWCLSADSSLLFHSGNGLVPTQLTVRCDREDDSVLKLPCGLELLEVGVRGMDEEAVKEPRYGLRLFSLPHALMMASPWFFGSSAATRQRPGPASPFSRKWGLGISHHSVLTIRWAWPGSQVP